MIFFEDEDAFLDCTYHPFTNSLAYSLTQLINSTLSDLETDLDFDPKQVAHCGGISELKRIAALTEMYDVALAPHCPMGPIALAACMQVGTSSANCMYAVSLLFSSFYCLVLICFS